MWTLNMVSHQGEKRSDWRKFCQQREHHYCCGLNVDGRAQMAFILCPICSIWHISCRLHLLHHLQLHFFAVAFRCVRFLSFFIVLFCCGIITPHREMPSCIYTQHYVFTFSTLCLEKASLNIHDWSEHLDWLLRKHCHCKWILEKYGRKWKMSTYKHYLEKQNVYEKQSFISLKIWPWVTSCQRDWFPLYRLLPEFASAQTDSYSFQDNIIFPSDMSIHLLYNRVYFSLPFIQPSLIWMALSADLMRWVTWENHPPEVSR